MNIVEKIEKTSTITTDLVSLQGNMSQFAQSTIWCPMQERAITLSSCGIVEKIEKMALFSFIDFFHKTVLSIFSTKHSHC